MGIVLHLVVLQQQPGLPSFINDWFVNACWWEAGRKGANYDVKWGAELDQWHCQKADLRSSQFHNEKQN